ncbi:N-methyl-L-tryptophan oxidase [Brevibacillus fluminis]|uniref:N-methyl-L-tryptophan oxidase n=1 Tax=Brevibacillus fluminis TaxID=511487 RepID=A0A3M8DXX9_9BACL|nr:N-methyl-L-tryptophan oxidase [Brevibacillus fluminis]RNB92395.1 N-methyl-L-tryptophan oxidase [Brevibacillus fluminis]
MHISYEVAIVGAGSMGMAAGYYLAKRGVRTLLIDSFDPPHSLGSHHGDTRIIRHAYGEGKQYVPLALRAQELWKELEQEAGVHLFENTGVLCVGSPESTFFPEVIASAQAYSLPLDVLEADEVMRRWPGIALPEGYRASFEPTSGVLYSEQCIRAFRKLAVEAGAKLVVNSPVESIDLAAQGAVIQAGGNRYAADKLIVSAGGWLGKLAGACGLSLPVKPTRKTVGWFQADEQLYHPGHFPAFTVNLAGGESYYGFPNFGGQGVKIGRHDLGQPSDPDQLNREFGIYAEDEGDVRRFAERFLPQAAGPLLQGKVCIYTFTPDEHFILDRHPEHAHVLLVGGTSGHGFKFASAIGEVLADLSTTGVSKHDLSLFRIGRFAES